MATVNLIDVNKFYAQKHILKNINLNIDKGEFVAVIGPSGCGKSTLLRLVTGLEQVSSGKVLINNQCVNEISPAKRDMAMVFQSYALYPHLSVYDNMAYALKMRKIPKKNIYDKVQEVAQMLQLTDYLSYKPADLSGGQRQRVAMGRAIVRSPAVFLFDEPLSNLDAKLRISMRHEIKKLHQSLNTTCLYVTHDQVEAMTMASKILVLNKGEIQQLGSPQTLYKYPNSLFVAEFIGNQPLTLIPGILNSKQKKISTAIEQSFPLPEIWANNLPTLTTEHAVQIALRAEHFEVVQETDEAAIKIRIEFIDNMGSDQTIHGFSDKGEIKFCIRLPSDMKVEGNIMYIRPLITQANVFDLKTGLRIGSWHEHQ